MNDERRIPDKPDLNFLPGDLDNTTGTNASELLPTERNNQPKERTMSEWLENADQTTETRNQNLVVRQLSGLETFEDALKLFDHPGFLLPEELITNPKLEQNTVGLVSYVKVREVLKEMESQYKRLANSPQLLEKYKGEFGPSRRPEFNNKKFNDTAFLDGRIIPKGTNTQMPLYEFFFGLLDKKKPSEGK